MWVDVLYKKTCKQDYESYEVIVELFVLMISKLILSRGIRILFRIYGNIPRLFRQSTSGLCQKLTKPE